MLPVIGALVAGLGLFFVGLNFLTEHLKMLSGRRLRERIATWTKRPLMGVLWGGVFIAITQSTAATMFILISMLRAGMVTVAQSLPMIIGVNVAAGLIVLILVFDIKIAILFPSLLKTSSAAETMAPTGWRSASPLRAAGRLNTQPSVCQGERHRGTGSLSSFAPIRYQSAGPKLAWRQDPTSSLVLATGMSHTGSIQSTNWANLRSDEVSGNDRSPRKTRDSAPDGINRRDKLERNPSELATKSNFRF